jgi:hypothetical protein
MADEVGLHRAVNRAQQARNILENPIYIESFKDLEAQLIAAWIASDPRDNEGRERCFAQIHANRKQRDYLASVMSNGSIAEAEIRELIKTTEHKKRHGIL